MAVHFAEHCSEDWGWLRSVITKPVHLCCDLKKKSMSCKLKLCAFIVDANIISAGPSRVCE